ncbi:hypothetical protein O3W44_19430 [Pantoea sp. LMR881]|uniref:hypothetical protein n=1 Tax=Pantoea sp. LMR881 TaxID=3014336 RepID=UPI0022AFDBDE|nr:hypothetical protein [Pantoea sp. LMR881]MCZ4060802.1 hypothetical protein [Pantoea sp. LMR881]
MSLHNDYFKKELTLSFCIFFGCLLSVIIAGLLVKLFFAIILWLLTNEFELTWIEILRGVKIGGFGGAILGFGIALFRVFKVKGF